MIKKALLILIFLSLSGNIALQAQHLSLSDSAIYYLKQVKALQHIDSVLLSKAVFAISNTPPASLSSEKIDAELKKLLPVIHKQNCLAIRTVVFFKLSSGRENDKLIKYSKGLISDLKNYSGEFEKNLLLGTLAQSRFLYRNTNRINEGVDYYQRLANYFEQAGDTSVTSICYWALAGFYRALGLMDKAIYCEMKSLNFINRNKIVKGNIWLFATYYNNELLTYVNRLVVLGSILLDNEEPRKAFPCLYEAKTIFESIKDSLEGHDGPNIYLQIIRAKIMTGGDSIPLYFDLMRKNMDIKNDPYYFSNYYQTRGYYYYLQNSLDSAGYFIRQSSRLKDSLRLMTNSPYGYLIPGYYLSLIKIKQHRFEDAIILLKEESQELLKVNLRRVALQEWLLLSTVYKLKGDFKNSAASLEQYITLQKQIIDDENKSRSMSFETEQQINLLNAEKQNQQKELSRQKFIRNLIIGGLVLMLLFSILFLIQRFRIAREKKRSEELLLNILPAPVAEELKRTGRCQAKTFSMVTVMFMDFKDFAAVSERVSGELLVDEINACFSAFDGIIQKYKVEKIKTVGDAYICAGGLPSLNLTHAIDIVNTAIEIQEFMLARKKEKEDNGGFTFDMRIGIHTGPVVAGIVGVKKFQYDIWGDTVNLAARMEQNSEAGKTNISGSTYKLVKDKFNCTYRGKIEAKNKGEVEMYFVESISSQGRQI